MAAYTGRKLSVSPNAYKYDLVMTPNDGLPYQVFPDRFGNLEIPDEEGQIAGAVTLAYINPSGETVRHVQDIEIEITNG